MKKVNFKNAMMALVVTLSFVFFGAAQVSAQSVSGSASSTSAIPTGDFVTASDAQDILMDKMLDLKVDMEGQSSGAIYTANDRLLHYYVGIRAVLESGQTNVPKAIVDGLGNLSDANGHGDLSAAELNALKQLAVVELSL